MFALTDPAASVFAQWHTPGAELADSLVGVVVLLEIFGGEVRVDELATSFALVI